jgi:hypothetical protein
LFQPIINIHNVNPDISLSKNLGFRTPTAPWRRMMYVKFLDILILESFLSPISYCQGLASMSERYERMFPATTIPGFPYLNRNVHVESLVQLHLQCKRRPGSISSNPYEQINGFHITFFEILGENLASEAPRGRWKVGNMIKDPEAKYSSLNNVFRESTYSVC